jgi:hypothetical protein
MVDAAELELDRAAAALGSTERGIMARRALDQTIAAGRPYAACPVDLGSTAGEAPHLVAQAAGRCGAPHWIEATRTVEVCLLDPDHADAGTYHAWPSLPDVAPRSGPAPSTMLAEQVDPVARIERRAAEARRQLAGLPSLVDQVLDDGLGEA